MHVRNGLFYQEKIRSDVQNTGNSTDRESGYDENETPSTNDSKVSSIFDFSCIDSQIVDTGPEGYIYVMKNGTIFAGPKVTKSSPRFHHSSFFAGKQVESSGLLIIENGVLKSLLPHSGHYRPRQDFHLLYMLILLKKKDIDLRGFSLDCQRIMKIGRSMGAGKFVVSLLNYNIRHPF